MGKHGSSQGGVRRNPVNVAAGQRHVNTDPKTPTTKLRRATSLNVRPDRKLKDGAVNLHMIDLGGDVTGNGISKLVFTILSAVAEAERDRTRERVAEVKRDQRQRGRYLGGAVPWGYRVGDAGELVPIPEQQAAPAPYQLR